MAAGVVSPVQKAMTDLETLQAKRRVKDIRLWERVDMASVPEYQRMVAYGQALLRVRVPEPIGKVAEHGIRKMREDILTVINGIIKFIEPFNPNIPTLMANDESTTHPATDPGPTSGHEHILQNPPSVDGIRQMLANAQAGLDSLFTEPPAPVPVKQDFGWALEQMRDGKKVAPAYWNGKKWLVMQFPDENSKMTMPYIYVEYPPNHRIPWAISNLELFAEDWMIIE